MQLGALPIRQIEPKTCLLASGENRLQWRPAIDHWSGATESIGKHDVGRDTECPIERGGEIFGGNWVIFWISTLAIGAAVGRSSLNACAGEQCREEGAPVIAAPLCIGFGGPPHFTDGNDQCVVQ